MFEARVRLQVLFAVRAEARVSLRAYSAVGGDLVAATAGPYKPETQEVCDQGVWAEAWKRHGNAMGLQDVQRGRAPQMLVALFAGEVQRAFLRPV